MLEQKDIERVVEAVLLAAADPVSVERLIRVFAPGELPEADPQQAVRSALGEIEYALDGRGYELKRVASGYRLQVRQRYSPWVSRLLEEKPPRYSRALLETLALIAYRQPATRGDIEAVRGVAVSPNILRTIIERGWIRAVGQRETPGRPTLYGTTRAFLDYFGLQNLDALPPLARIREQIELREMADATSADAAGATAGEADAAPPAEIGDGNDAARDASATHPSEPAQPDAGDQRPLAEVVRLPTER